MQISLVICSRNRVEKLKKCLEAIDRLDTNLEWELVIVDNGSTDGTPAFLKDFQTRFRGNCHVISEPTSGLGRARNAGWRAASGEIIAYTDDDCSVDSYFLNDVVDCFEEHHAQKLGFLGGKILHLDPSDVPVGTNDNEEPEEIPPGSFVQAGFAQGSNMSFSRRALAEVGGFDDAFGAGTPFPAEDVELQARISASGWFGLYDPRPTVYHFHGRRLDDPQVIEKQLELGEEYDSGRGAYYAKCILDERMRETYLKAWAENLAKGEPITNYRELRAAFQYLKENL